jgi:hypothetical protein
MNEETTAELKGEADNSTLNIKDFNTWISILGRTTMQTMNEEM